MKSKEKTKKYIKVTKKKIIFFLVFGIIVLLIVWFYNSYLTKKEVFAQEINENINKISNASELNVEKIIEENSKNKESEKYLIEESDLEYITKYRNNNNLPKGVLQVVQEGREGKQQIEKKIIYDEHGEIVKEEQLNSRTTKAAINKIVEVGTGSKTNNYKVKIGDLVYTTSDRSSIKTEPNDGSQKIATLAKGCKLKVLDICGEWYKITGRETTGYIKSENTTCIDVNTNYENNTTNNSNSQQVTKLTYGIQLNKPSGLSLEQFKKVLSDPKDKNKIFSDNAEYFYFIEKQYNINGVFVAAVGIHESAWGTSNIARNKNNLFGYGAYDSNPYNGAYQFSNYSESIDLIARVFVKYYLNPKGTNIYDGEKAAGTYYNGANLSGVNQKYASDKNWANSVYEHMKYLYNKL